MIKIHLCDQFKLSRLVSLEASSDVAPASSPLSSLGSHSVPWLGEGLSKPPPS